MPLLPMTQRSVVVKNTFIEEKDEETASWGLQSIHALGANTCIARLSTDSNKLSDWCSDGDMSQASTPIMCDSTISGLSEGTFMSTPTGSECSFPLDGELMNVARTMPSGQQDLSTSSVARRKIWLNIPVEVPYDSDSSPDDFDFTVTSTIVNRDSGCASIDVKVSLNNNRKVLPLAVLVPDSRTCVDATQKLGAKAQVAASPPSRLSDKVCCHWKNKGWCKYQECCKFQHPVHKRGVGSTKRI